MVSFVFPFIVGEICSESSVVVYDHTLDNTPLILSTQAQCSQKRSHGVDTLRSFIRYSLYQNHETNNSELSIQ